LKERTGMGRGRFAALVALVIVSGLGLTALVSPRIESNPPSSTTSETASTSLVESASSSTSSTTTSLSQNASQVELEVYTWTQTLNGGCCYLLGYYLSTSTISWYGDIVRNTTGFTGGTWAGQSEIHTFFDQSLGTLRPSPSLATVSDIAATQVQGGDINASFFLALNGTSTISGAINATVEVQQEWEPNGGGSTGWSILAESWDFLSSHIQYSQATSQVALQISDWERSVDNVCCNTSSYYNNSSVISWSGNFTDGSPIFFKGTWAGSEGINDYLGSTLGWIMPSPTMLTISNLTLDDIGGGTVNASFHLVVNGTNGIAGGGLHAVANVEMQWTFQAVSGFWYIHYESWDFSQTYVQYHGEPSSMSPSLSSSAFRAQLAKSDAQNH
jgi:hypothetical protein